MIIVNPRSRGGLSERDWAKLVGPLTEGIGPFDARFTQRRGHARDLAKEEALRGCPLVVAFGGDGTISEVADGLLAAGTGTELGIIPRGTGGDLRRTLGLPENVREAAARVRTGAVHQVDVGLATFVGSDGAPGQRHFVNVASFGFSSAVALAANDSRKTFGAKASFLSATVRSLVSYQNAEVLMSADGGERQRRTILLAAVGNGRFFGGGMKICPDALMDDGKLDLVTVGDLGTWNLLANMHRIYSGTHLSLKQVSSTRLSQLSVWPADPTAKIPIELDGETPGHLPATFAAIPDALRVRF